MKAPYFDNLRSQMDLKLYFERPMPDLSTKVSHAIYESNSYWLYRYCKDYQFGLNESLSLTDYNDYPIFVNTTSFSDSNQMDFACNKYSGIETDSFLKKLKV